MSEWEGQLGALGGDTAVSVGKMPELEQQTVLGPREMGDQALNREMLTLRLAADRAFAQAGISSAADADVIEIHAPFDSAETMAYPPLRLCAAQDGPDFVATGFPTMVVIRRSASISRLATRLMSSRLTASISSLRQLT